MLLFILDVEEFKPHGPVGKANLHFRINCILFYISAFKDFSTLRAINVTI